jgi:hypothetical protein
VRLLVLGRVCDLCASSASRVDPQATQRLDAASFWPCTGSDPRTFFTRNALLTLGRCSDRYFRQTIKPHYHERQLHLARVLGSRLSLGKDLCPDISPAEARKAGGGKGRERAVWIDGKLSETRHETQRDVVADDWRNKRYPRDND